MDAEVVRARAWIARWWAGEAGIAGRLLDAVLWPAEQLFQVAAGLRNLAYNRAWITTSRAPIPVVSVGNIAVGGAGKTPIAAWIADRLAGWGLRSAIVLRGYGEDEIRVHQELNPDIPVFADARRLRAVAAAAAAGRTVAVLDDAFQHRALARDLDLLLISVEGWRTQRKLLPRGPWRESAAALARADIVILTRKTATEGKLVAVRDQITLLSRGRPVVDCHIAPSGISRLHSVGQPAETRERFRGTAVLAVAALADPEPFAEHLRAAGAKVELAAYPDHHAFSAPEAAALVRRAAGRPIIMTLKDAVKLRELVSPMAEAYVLHQMVEIGSGAEVLDSALRAATEGGRS